MSQVETLKLMHELGGEGTNRQLHDYAAANYPTMTHYLHRRLRQLAAWGMVTYEDSFAKKYSGMYKHPDMPARKWKVNYNDPDVLRILGLTVELTNISKT